MTVAIGRGGGSGSGRDRACSALWFKGVKLQRARQKSTNVAKRVMIFAMKIYLMGSARVSGTICVSADALDAGRKG
jgi:hypothetical protein